VANLGERASSWAGEDGLTGESAGLRTVVGFENHSGLTYLQGETVPLAQVEVGLGNLADGGGEGAVYKNAIGTYLHGSLLPKNPHIADHLLTAALRRRGHTAPLVPLDDGVELRAHAAAIERARSARTAHLFQA
jgi:CobQ-like glutamine amidotransferase family enzyme